MVQQGLFAFDRRQRNPDLPGGGRLSATVHVNLGMPAHDQRTGKGVSLPVTTGNGHIGTLRSGAYALAYRHRFTGEQRLVAPEIVGAQHPADRKSVVTGKSGSVRVELGGRRHSKKHTESNTSLI